MGMAQIILLSISGILLSVLLYLFIKKKMFVEVQLQITDLGHLNSSNITLIPILIVRNHGELPAYLDCYVLNGSKYPCDNFYVVAHPKHNESFYPINMPSDNTDHVSVALYFHDIFNRRWCTNILCDKVGDPQSWQGRSTTRRSLHGEESYFTRR